MMRWPGLCDHNEPMIEYEPGRSECSVPGCSSQGPPDLPHCQVISENGKHDRARCGCDECWKRRNYPADKQRKEVENQTSRPHLPLPKGEKHPCAKLTEDQVLNIRESYKQHSMLVPTDPSGKRQAEISNACLRRVYAAEYAVTQETIALIIKRKIWKDVK